MKMEISKTLGAASKNGVKFLIHSPSGHGKTTLLKTVGKTFLLSFEKGDLALNDADNIDVVYPKTMADLREAYVYISEHLDDYDTVAIDSITELGEVIVSDLKKDPEFSSMKDGMKLWMKYSEVMLGIAKSFRDLQGINVVIIALSETRKENFEDRQYPMIPANKVQLKLPSLYDEVLYLNVSESGERELITQPTSSVMAKDRSGKLDPVEVADLGQLLVKILGEVK